MATKIICRASDCIFWEDKFCTSEEITYDPEEGCLTYEVLVDVIDLDAEEEEWEDDDFLTDDDLDDDDDDEEEEDLWDDDEEDLFLDEETDDRWNY